MLAKLFVDLLMEDLNEELYMASQAGLGLGLYLTKVKKERRDSRTYRSVAVPMRDTLLLQKVFSIS